MSTVLDITNTAGSSYNYAFATVRNNTNIQLDNVGGVLGQRLTGIASTTLGSQLGVPQVAQIGQSLTQASENYNPGLFYTSVPFTNLNKLPGVLYQDFRSRKGYSTRTLTSLRLDGSSAVTRNLKKPWIAAAYAAASASPAGAYSVFNRDANSWFGAGWGDHGNIYALRNDFTAQSHVAKVWKVDRWKPTVNALALATPFRGDRVQVIDYRKAVNLNKIYQWKDNILGISTDFLGITQDFIKFFFTGPKLEPGLNKDIRETITDDAIVFRAAITSITDSFNPGWQAVQMIGRADSNYHYTSYSRDLSISFNVFATDRDEMKPIWRKLNALAGYTAPAYNDNSISLEAPWLRFTLGDLFFQQPAIITSLSYTLHDSNTTWEINIEGDETMMQVPKIISVTMALTIVTNELPQKGGKFYTLAKQFDSDNQSKPGNNNWLSDMKMNPKAPVTPTDTTNTAGPITEDQAAAQTNNPLLINND